MAVGRRAYSCLVLFLTLCKSIALILSCQYLSFNTSTFVITEYIKLYYKIYNSVKIGSYILYSTTYFTRRTDHKQSFLDYIMAVNPRYSVIGFYHGGQSTNQRSWILSRRLVHTPAFLGSIVAVGPQTSVPGFYHGGQSTHPRS